jgi:hypothetical protein
MRNFGGWVKDIRRRGRSLAASVPMPAVRRKRRSPVVFTVPAVALAGVAAAAGVLMWDGRRRTAVRRRFEQATDAVASNVNRAPATVGD